MKTILVPIDFHEASGKTFRYLENIYRDSPVNLLLIYVADPAQGISHDSIQEKFDDFERSVLKGYSLPYTFSIAQGNIVDELQRSIDHHKPSLLAIGIQGTRLVNSLVKLANCPLFIIPNEGDIPELKSMLYAHDFNAIQESSVLEPLWQLAKNHHASVHVLHVTRDDSMTEDKGEGPLEYYLDQIEHEYATIISNDFVQAIHTYAGKKNISLLVLLLREHGQNATNSKGELVENLLATTNIPMLILV
jgi:hypothetical protein